MIGQFFNFIFHLYETVLRGLFFTCCSEKRELRGLAAHGVIHVVKRNWLEDCYRVRKEVPVMQKHIAFDILLCKGFFRFLSMTGIFCLSSRSIQYSCLTCFFCVFVVKWFEIICSMNLHFTVCTCAVKIWWACLVKHQVWMRAALSMEKAQTFFPALLWLQLCKLWV